MPGRSHSEARPPRVPHQPAGPAEEGSLADQQKWLMEMLLNALTARDREMLLRFYVREQSPDQICAEMGITETQFRLVKSRAKARFAELRRIGLTRKRPTVATSATPSVPTGNAVVDIERIVPIVAHAVAVFGDQKKASHWLATPLALPGNLSPAQVLARGTDGEAIDQILTRIEHNIPS